MDAQAEHAERARPIRIRTCIATREQLPDTRLLRVVADPDTPGRVVPDPSRSLPGRGAWIKPTLDALELAEGRRAFARALRMSPAASAAVDVSQVRTYLVHATNDPHDDRKTEH